MCGERKKADGDEGLAFSQVQPDVDSTYSTVKRSIGHNYTNQDVTNGNLSFDEDVVTFCSC